MTEVRTEIVELPAPRERYVDYAAWLKETYGYVVDPAQAQTAVNRYHAFQASDFNQQKNAERIAANRAAREERAKAWAERRAAAAERRTENQEKKDAKAEAKAAKAEAKAAEKAEREANQNAAEASAPKRGKRRGRNKAEVESAEAVETTETEAGTISADGVEFSAEGSKREMPEWSDQ